MHKICSWLNLSSWIIYVIDYEFQDSSVKQTIGHKITQNDPSIWRSGVERSLSSNIMNGSNTKWLSALDSHKLLRFCVRLSGSCFNIKAIISIYIGIPIVRIRQSWDCLIFIMGISMLVRLYTPVSLIVKHVWLFAQWQKGAGCSFICCNGCSVKQVFYK